MAFPWIGFVDPVVDVAPVALDGPDPLTSAAYATDYNEVRRVGAVDSPLTERSAEQTAIAQFFAANPVLTYRVALCDLLDREPMGLLPTTRMFARIDPSERDSEEFTAEIRRHNVNCSPDGGDTTVASGPDVI